MFVERTGRLDQMDRSAYVDFWQMQGDETIVRAALETSNVPYCTVLLAAPSPCRVN